MSRIWAVKQIRIVYTGGMNTEADQVDQLSRLMMEIDHILAMISECVTVNENNAKRHSCLHALFQEKVKSAIRHSIGGLMIHLWYQVGIMYNILPMTNVYYLVILIVPFSKH